MLKRVSFYTHEGPYLKVNEDLIDVDIDLNLYSIMDGFGGSGIGDVATLDTKNLIKKHFTKISHDEDATMPFYFSAKYLLETNALINAFFQCHHFLLKTNEKRKIEYRAGVSLLSFAMTDDMGVFVGCGNTEALLIREHKVATLISPDNFEYSSGLPRKDRVYSTLSNNALGLFEDFTYKVLEYRPKIGDRVLLATDGLYSLLEESEILACFENEADDVAIIKKLNEANNVNGNWDNQSGIILRF